jgi:hypothetical protein
LSKSGLPEGSIGARCRSSGAVDGPYLVRPVFGVKKKNDLLHFSPPAATIYKDDSQQIPFTETYLFQCWGVSSCSVPLEYSEFCSEEPSIAVELLR